MANTMSRWIFAAAALLPTFGALAAELVVIASNAQAYTPGQTLDAAKPVVLGADHFVVLATEDGRVVRFDGPRNEPVSSVPPDAESPPADDVIGALARLFGRGAPELGGVAGVRGSADFETAADTRPDAWLIHSEHTGDQCFIADRSPELWRESAASAIGSDIEDVLARTAVRLEWARDAQRAAWPSASLPQSGRVYLLRRDIDLRSVAIRLQSLPQSLGGDDLASVAWLASRGCFAQARLLFSQIVARNQI